MSGQWVVGRRSGRAEMALERRLDILSTELTPRENPTNAHHRCAQSTERISERRDEYEDLRIILSRKESSRPEAHVV